MDLNLIVDLNLITRYFAHRSLPHQKKTIGAKWSYKLKVNLKGAGMDLFKRKTLTLKKWMYKVKVNPKGVGDYMQCHAISQ